MRKLLFIPFLFFASLVYSEKMIEISVEITEVNENKSLELGIEWPTEISAVESTIPSIIESGAWERITAFTTTLKTLETNGAAKVLSKPKLVTKSGTTAKFMVGGEFPVVATAVGTSKIEWKEFGIIMKITRRTERRRNRHSSETELSRLTIMLP